jgi:protein dithiol oxidoreductase (disulfide-forming)
MGNLMKLSAATLMGVLALILAPLAPAAQTWTEGRNFELITPAQQNHAAKGKVEVMEVFSYGCPACNGFQPVIAALEHSLPANARMVFLPASFKPEEDWPMLQRAYFTAQALGIAGRTHQAIFDAVWKSGELGITDPTTRRLKSPLPSIEDAAKCYERLTGVKADTFLATARSFSVDLKMRTADAQIIAMQVPSTPCIVVNGKYRVIMDSLRSEDDLIGVVRYLVDRESEH